MTCIFRIFIIIVIKLCFIARLNQKHLAQKSVTEESLAVINLNEYVLRLVLQSDNHADLRMNSGCLFHSAGCS